MGKLPKVLADYIRTEESTWYTLRNFLRGIEKDGKYCEPDGNWVCYGYNPENSTFGVSTIMMEDPMVWLTKAELMSEVGPLYRGFNGEF